MLKNNFFFSRILLENRVHHRSSSPRTPARFSAFFIAFLALRSSQATPFLENDHPQLLGYITAGHFTTFAVYCFTNVNILASSHSILFAVLLFFLKHFSKTPPWFARFNTLKDIQLKL